MKLVDAMFDVFNASKIWFRISILSSMLLVTLSVIGLFDYFKESVVLFAVLSILLQVFSFFSRVVAESKLDLGEYIRRSFMLSDGLGIVLSSKEIARIMRLTGKTIFASSPAGKDYYESKASPGALRLAEVLRESSFFTSYLSQTASYFFFAISAVAFLCFIISLYVTSTTLANLQSMHSISTAILSLIGFIVSSDFLSFAIKFKSLHESSEDIYNCADAMLKSSPNPLESDVLLLFGDYNCAAVAAPPIPEFIHKYKRDFLNELWRKSRNP